jgi:hypothetical protein
MAEKVTERQQDVIAPIVFISVLTLVYGCIAVFLFKRQKNKRQLQPPEIQVALRGPGESLRRKMEDCFDELTHTLLLGACGTALLAIAPVLVLKWRSDANVLILLGSSLALFAAGAIFVVARAVRLLHERSNARLGWLGECIVAEHLQACALEGYHIYHDVPMAVDGRVTNIDHVAVGPRGAVVIETKMRSKPANMPTSQHQVTFDGERISWPRFADDTKTLWQIQQSAQWLEAHLRAECGITVPVRQVIAIPGWRVNEKVLGQPRVVSGKGVADAVLQAAGAKEAALLSKAQLQDIRGALEKLCRDVEL